VRSQSVTSKAAVTRASTSHSSRAGGELHVRADSRSGTISPTPAPVKRHRQRDDAEYLGKRQRDQREVRALEP
jgi:hypothetical protein